MRVLSAGVAGGRMSIMITRRRKSPEQIVRLLGQADQLLANDEDLASVCWTLGISESSFHRWRGRKRVELTDWHHEYNNSRRHSSLGYQAPSQYAHVCTCTKPD